MFSMATMGETEQQAASIPGKLLTLALWARDRLSRLRFWHVLLVLLTAAYFFALLLHPPNIYDEGLTVDGAVRILHGQLPYRDFNTGYAPAEFYTVAAVFSAFGTTLLAARIWDTLWRLAILGMAIALARGATQESKIHALPLVCIGLVTGACGTRLYPMTNSATSGFMLASLVALFFSVQYFNTRQVRKLFWAGVTTGIAILYRHDLGACLAAAIMIAAWYRVIAERQRQLTRSTVIFVAGILAVLVLPLVYFWIRIPHDALVQSFVDFPRTNLAGRYIPLLGPGSILAWSVLYLPLAIMLTTVFGFPKTQPNRRPALVLFLVLSASVLAQAAQRLDAPHAYPVVIFSLLLLSICIDQVPERGRILAQLLLFSGAALCYAVLPVFFWMFQITGANQTASEAAAKVSYSDGQNADYVPRAGPIHLAEDQRQAVVYVRQHLAPGKSLYVGAEKHGLAWYNDALFYFLADRPQATRFDMFVPGITTGEAVQSEILESIRRQKTEYVVLFKIPLSQEANLSSVDNGVTLLDDAIRQDYMQVAQLGRYSIWHRKSG
jgi:hypothetical protein